MLLLNTDLEPEYINYRHPSIEKLGLDHSSHSFDIMKWEEYVSAETKALIREAIDDGLTWQGELRFGDANQAQYLQTTISPVVNSEGQLRKIVVCCDDISEHKAITDRLFIREHYNVLTGLPNRQFALRSLHSAIDKCAASKHEFIIVHIDLDRIRYINESLGHHIVDKIFIETGIVDSYLQWVAIILPFCNVLNHWHTMITT
jgi:predicted signal transduction protein with EAL and GGDEF domain